MMSDLLSQDEINALLSGSFVGGESEPAAGTGSSASLSPSEDKTFNEISNVFVSSLQSVLGMLTGKDVSVSSSGTSVSSQMEIASSIEPNPFVLRAKCGGINDAPIAIIIPQRGAQLLSDMMMGGEGKDLSGVLSELDISAAQEGISQVIGSAFTSMSGLLKGGRLMPDAVNAKLEEDSWDIFPGNEEDVCSLKLHVSVPGVSDFDMNIATPKTMVQSFSKMLEEVNAVPKAEAAPAPRPAPQQAAQQAQQAQQMQAQPQAQAPQFNLPMGAAQQPAPMVDVRPAEFSQLGARGSSGSTSRIDLVADIPVRVTVELGRTRKNISDVLNMSAGSVIELDKMAGEPVDVLVNGKLIAKGEVVVIDENFGVRITEIINSVSRAYS